MAGGCATLNTSRYLPISLYTLLLYTMTSRLLTTFLALLLVGCDIPGMGPDPRIAQREAEGKAVGGACRQALRGIEDCYQLNAKASKTAIFAGWKEMDQYMRENKLEGQRPAPEKAAIEEIIDEKKPASSDKDKTAGAKAPAATDKGKAAEKPADKPEKH